MKKKSTDLLLAALLLSLAAAPAHAQTQTLGGGKFPARRMLVEADMPRTDTQGRRLYAINLNPFVLQESMQLYGKNAETDIATVDPAIRPHRNSKGVVLFADRISRMQGVKIERVLSALSQTVYAWMPEHVAAQLARVDYVVSVRGVEASAAAFSAAGDIVNGAEISSWALPYTNTNDATTTSNAFYLLDAVLDNPPHPELNVVYRQDSPSAMPNPLHSTAVAGLVGARQNGQLVRGINPGQPLKAFGLGDLNEETVANALDVATRYADGIGEFAVLNMSFNTYPGSANWFASSQKWGRRMRAASNRFFITQSAGNAYTDGRSPLETDACKLAYNAAGTARDNDGIVVVGGLQRDGSRFGGAENSAQWGGFASGSTVGPCIEAWAPAHEITNLIYSGGTEAVSGTSFAAPIVAAIASRYGDGQTRPLEREAYIKAGLAATGYSAAGLPLKKVQYVAPAQVNIPKRLPVVAATSPTNSANLASLYDGKFFSDVDYWNAQTNWGSVTLDLGQVRTVTGVRITVRTSASDLAGTAQPIDFAVSAGVPGAVFGGSTGGGQVSYGAPVYYTEADQSDVAPVYIALSGGARYLKIEANNPYSWLAYSEIEIYGY